VDGFRCLAECLQYPAVEMAVLEIAYAMSRRHPDNSRLCFDAISLSALLALLAAPDRSDAFIQRVLRLVGHYDGFLAEAEFDAQAWLAIFLPLLNHASEDMRRQVIMLLYPFATNALFGKAMRTTLTAQHFIGFMQDSDSMVRQFSFKLLELWLDHQIEKEVAFSKAGGLEVLSGLLKDEAEAVVVRAVKWIRLFMSYGDNSEPDTANQMVFYRADVMVRLIALIQRPYSTHIRRAALLSLQQLTHGSEELQTAFLSGGVCVLCSLVSLAQRQSYMLLRYWCHYCR
jgi:hypothetical protein